MSFQKALMERGRNQSQGLCNYSYRGLADLADLAEITVEKQKNTLMNAQEDLDYLIDQHLSGKQPVSPIDGALSFPGKG